MYLPTNSRLITPYFDRQLTFLCIVKMGSMFEMRLEASIAVGFSLVTLIISSTVCCSQRHHGIRVVTSLVTMFLAGK